MIPKGSRLTRESIRAIQREGKRVETPFFIIYSVDSTSPHVGVVVSNSVSKKATKRNTIRRKAHVALLDYIKNHQNDMLLVAKKSAANASKKSLQADLLSALYEK